jgi:hypothetical protein
MGSDQGILGVWHDQGASVVPGEHSFADLSQPETPAPGHCPLPARKAGAEGCLAAVSHQPRLLSTPAPKFDPRKDLRLVRPAARASLAPARYRDAPEGEPRVLRVSSGVAGFTVSFAKVQGEPRWRPSDTSSSTPTNTVVNRAESGWMASAPRNG